MKKTYVRSLSCACLLAAAFSLVGCGQKTPSWLQNGAGSTGGIEAPAEPSVYYGVSEGYFMWSSFEKETEGLLVTGECSLPLSAAFATVKLYDASYSPLGVSTGNLYAEFDAGEEFSLAISVPSETLEKTAFVVVRYTGMSKEEPTGEEPAAQRFVGFSYGAGGAQRVVRAGETVTPPIEPQKSGFTFEGWRSDKTLSATYDFTTPVTEDLILYPAFSVDESFFASSVSALFKESMLTLSTKSYNRANGVEYASESVSAPAVVVRETDGEYYVLTNYTTSAKRYGYSHVSYTLEKEGAVYEATYVTGSASYDLAVLSLSKTVGVELKAVSLAETATQGDAVALIFGETPSFGEVGVCESGRFSHTAEGNGALFNVSRELAGFSFTRGDAKGKATSASLIAEFLKLYLG